MCVCLCVCLTAVRGPWTFSQPVKWERLSFLFTIWSLNSKVSYLNAGLRFDTNCRPWTHHDGVLEQESQLCPRGECIVGEVVKVQLIILWINAESYGSSSNHYLLLSVPFAHKKWEKVFCPLCLAVLISLNTWDNLLILQLFLCCNLFNLPKLFILICCYFQVFAASCPGFPCRRGF